MIILEEPYVSEALLLFLDETQIPVLKNDFVRKMLTHSKLNILDEERFVECYRSSKDSSLYTVSEYALDWLYHVFPQEKLIEQVTLLKDKVAFRKACYSLYEEFYFKEVNLSDLADFDIAELSFPVVLKPSLGFLSTGVYTISSLEDWNSALDDIQRNFMKRAAMFPDKVVADSRFIIESHISGDEYAIDLYFDDNEPVIINIFEHPFASKNDVSDRLYSTSKALFDKYLLPFTEHITRLNKVLKLDNIPVHLELRMDHDKIVPIEINPLRFAGLCLNELHYYIAGKHPLSYYFSKSRPDYQAMWRGKEQKIFSFSIFQKSEEVKDESLDIEKLERYFSHILEVRPVNNPNLNISAFVFSEAEGYDKSEIEKILKLDMKPTRLK